MAMLIIKGDVMAYRRVITATWDLRQRRLRACPSLYLPIRSLHRCAAMHAGRASPPRSPERLEQGTTWSHTPVTVGLHVLITA